MLPIRARLTAWYVALLALVIAALGAFLVVRLRADRLADVDRSLRSSASQIARGYASEGRAELLDTSDTVLGAVPEGDPGAQLIGPDGRVAVAYHGDLPAGPVLPRADLGAVRAGRPLTRTVSYGGEPLRVVARPAAHRTVLVVGTSIEGLDAAVDRLAVLLLLAGPAALAATALGGWWLARMALRPVARMTAQAERIEVDRLDERVPVPPTRDEIARLARTLNGMLDRLAAGVEEKRRLVADASHELRTPLAAMRSELDVALAYDELEPAAALVLESAREEVERMSRIVENLLTLARADEGRLELAARPVDLRTLADEVAAALEPVASGQGVDLAVEGDAAETAADPDRIRQVLTNLVDNAVRFSPPGGRVRLRTWQRPGEAGVTVSDLGLGIPAEALPRVFDRFYRGDPARGRDGGGSGLGLAICREIVRAHGGRIWATSEEGRGSAFSFGLPAGPAAERPLGDASVASRR